MPTPDPAQGAFVSATGVEFHVWAPSARRVELVLHPESSDRRRLSMQGDGGHFHVHVSEARAGDRYSYQLDGGPLRPDPATRWQPDGVHRASAVFDPADFAWSDAGWAGIPRHELVIYELHVGTFTPEGTLDAVIPRLDQLRELGATALEIMPVSQFPGTRNWGYDGVHPYAVQNSYGGPRALQRLVDAAHAVGLAVILDVVYNHFGPEGNYLSEFGPYFTRRHHTPWGSAVNYDGRRAGPVRQFVCDNVRMWIRDFHLDGLRLDAIQTIYDDSRPHILAEIQAAAQEEAAAAGRKVHVIGETDENRADLTARPEQGGMGLDAVWSDELHHSVHAYLTDERGGEYIDFGDPSEIANALNRTFVYDGRDSLRRGGPFGSSVVDQDPSRFVVCLQNHDQVGNRAVSDRIDELLTPSARRLATALVLLSPNTPLLFMGEEYGETRRFPFFCSFEDERLIRSVREGRRRDLELKELGHANLLLDPQAPETFEASRLAWQWAEGTREGELRQLYRDLLKVRRGRRPLGDHAELSARVLDLPGHPQALLTYRYGNDYTLLANLTSRPFDWGEPVRAELLLSTELANYGGSRTSCDGVDSLLHHEACVFRGIVNLTEIEDGL